MSKVPEVKRVLSNFQNILDSIITFSNELGVTEEEFNKSIHRLTTPKGKDDLKKISTLIFKKERNSSSTTHTVIGNHRFLTNRLGSDWKEEKHQCCCEKGVTLEKRNGNLYLNDTKIERYFSPNQKNGNVVRGRQLRNELADKPVLCTCILDYLLDHQELIPDDWKTGRTYFWGTIFRDPDGDLCVAYLGWHGGQWSWNYSWLVSDWDGGDPAAVCASK